jgi:CubicO group peptidase (beta-lactamase class C family)
MRKRRFSRFAGTAAVVCLLIMGARGGPHRGASVFDKGAEIDKLFDRWNTAETPGGAVVVILDGNIVHQKGYGMANLEWRIPNTPETVFCIGSVSKQFTAYCIALLEARGKLRLEDDYRKYIPEMPDYGERITVGDLVHHTSGIRDDQMLWYLGDWEQGELHGAREVIDQILAKQKGLLFRPGREFDYSNANYLLLGEIVRRVGGTSLREFARDNIFRPLGMTRTFFLDDFREIVRSRAWSYVLGEGGTYRAYIDTNDLVGAGGVHTTILDMARWNANFDAPRAGDAGIVRRVLVRGRLSDGNETAYAFGLEHDVFRGRAVVRHDGSYGGYKAMFLRIPEERFAVFCAANADDVDARRVCYQAARIYLGDRLPVPSASPGPRLIELPGEALNALAGAYRNTRNMDLMTVSVKSGRLVCRINEELSTEYAPVSVDEFRPVTPGLPFFLKVGKPGPAARAELHAYLNGKRSHIYEPIERAAPAESDLREYEGFYHGNELSTTYRFEVRGGELFVRFKRAPKSPLRRIVKDQFAAWPLIFDFFRDENGRIRGFRLGRIGLQGIPFLRLEPAAK